MRAGILIAAVLLGSCERAAPPAPWASPMAGAFPPTLPVPGPAVPPVPVPPVGDSAAPSPVGDSAAPSPANGSWPLPSWLCADPVAALVRNRGGSSITFRLRVQGGGRAAFKPAQLAGFSRYRAELAAYRLSELLGYGRVPPSCERTLSSGALANAAGADAAFVQRLARELRPAPGRGVPGAAILWAEGIQPLAVWPRQIRGHALEAALSDMVLFDELCGNWDRWSGGNVFADAAGQALVLIDNAAGFGPIGGQRRERMDAVLDRIGSPTPSMLASLQRLSRAEVALALAPVGYGDAAADAVIARRDRTLSRLVSTTAATAR